MTSALATQHVLIVEDDSDIRAIVTRMLAPLGVNILEATNGRQALSILKKQSVDVVLSDLVMPRMSGLMLLHSMLEAGHHMPFILTTGYSDKESAIQALRLGAFDYLEKPVHASDLLSVMQEALKVSAEQQQLIGTLRASTKSTGDAPQDRNVELQIMRMRSFRFKNDAGDLAESNDSIRNWHDLKELFIQEAEPQLVFNESSIKALAASESRETDLAFVLRVIQSVRIASEAIRLNDIAEFAWALETAVGAFKHSPQTMTAQHIELMVHANRLIRDKVVALTNQEARDVRQQLSDVSEALRKRSA